MNTALNTPLNVTPNPMVHIHANRPKLFTAKRFVDTKKLSQAEWLEVRRQGIGSSDCAAACGLNPYMSAHPTKRFRPIAAGVLPIGLAYAMAVALIIGSLGVSLLATNGTNLAIVMAVYIALQLGYCFGWKHVPVIDIALVSSGFMLRAMAGGVAAGIVLSQWFLLVAAFGSLFMASGKRYAEILLAESSGAKIRKALEGYTPTYLRFVWTLSATAVVLSYALWGFDMASIAGGSAAVWYQVSMVPFTVAILLFASEVDRGNAGAPDELALSSRALQILAVAWLLTIAVAVYVVPALA